VLEEIRKVLRFWLDRGVAGFRCDVINILWKDSLASSRKKLLLTGSEHYLTKEGTHQILRELRKILDEYGAFTVGETVFVDPAQARDLCAPERGELDMVFSFDHMECDQHLVKWFKAPFHWKKFIRTLDRWQRELPWNSLYLENHDQPRSLSRFGSAAYPVPSARLLATLLLTLRGTPFIYQGQEIGMTNFDFTSMDQVQDVESHNIDRLLRRLGVPAGKRWNMIRRTSRDNARTPMQWTAGPGGGFTTGTPWLGVNANCAAINVAAQRDDPQSLRSWYRQLIALRRATPDLRQGDYELLSSGETLSAYRRGALTVVLNHSDHPQRTAYTGETVLSSYGYWQFNGTLQPWEAVILR
jgi:oligo-1,6-glucosidase